LIYSATGGSWWAEQVFDQRQQCQQHPRTGPVPICPAQCQQSPLPHHAGPHHQGLEHETSRGMLFNVD